MLPTLALALTLAACGDKADDSGSTADGGSTSDGGGSFECNTDNEDCAPGTCSGEGADMLPGSDCVACHSPGNFEEDEDDAFWSVAGTVFADIDGTDGASGVTVRVTDSTGETVELQTHSSGNFYSTRPLTPPLTAEVEIDGSVHEMVSEVETGSCNSCHRCEGEASGKLYAD